MRLIRNRVLLKSFTLFFALEIILSTVLPSVSWALTGGPSAPEFSSFEPVDTTDMVNLATGDFIYNTPVIEIPGPEGGYPLSLSYHSGIRLDQEASWVGLGFTLNPGSINRTVNGYADDNVETKRQVRDYWGGGSSVTRAHSIGLSYALSNFPANVGIGASWSTTTDTYLGFSAKSSITHMAGVNVKGISLQGQVSGDSEGKVQASGSVTKNFPSGTSLGISINSKGVKANITLAGYLITQVNNFSGRTTSVTTTKDKGEIGISYGAFSITYGEKAVYSRYWSDESQNLYSYGSLYPGLANIKIKADHYSSADSPSDLISYGFDTYEIYDDPPAFDRRIRNPDGLLIDDLNDPTKQTGGSLPAYDQFNVLGQGIGGVMQPFIFENGDLYGQSMYERSGLSGAPVLSFPTLEYISMKKFSQKKVDFRFLNDFSNALTVTPATVHAGSTEVDSHTVHALAEGFNDDGLNQKLAGSKHIEWFSNEEIVNGSAKNVGFVDAYDQRSDRKLTFDVYENYMQPEAGLPYSGRTYGKGEGSFTEGTYMGSDPYAELTPKEFRSLKPREVDLRKKIGGFMITNETGVTYHYALPVYNYNEYTRAKVKDPSKGTSTFREYKNDDPYAYTWLLTAITGPDYVDRSDTGDGNGILDDADWGYWVKFDYGRWADSYQWRTPHTGYLGDVESESLVFSYGIKELYYLDAIETRSHKAIFIKSKRKDGKGVTSRLEGGSKPRFFNMHYKWWVESMNNTADLPFYISPVSTMKLDAIYLFNKADFNEIPFNKSRGEKYREATSKHPYKYGFVGDPYTYTVPSTSPSKTITIKPEEDFVYVKYHNGDLVYDDDDIHDLPQFKESALRVIEFNTDYSLAKGVPNSIGHLSDIGFNPCGSFVCTSPSGVMERIGNEYEWPLADASCMNPAYSPFNKGGDCCSRPEMFYSYHSIFNLLSPLCADTYVNYRGNNITYLHTGKLTLNSLKFLGKGGADLIPSTEFVYSQENNHDYSKENYDQWGFYKSDFNNEPQSTRRITSISASNADAWTLTSIKLPLGSTLEMEFEPNQYYKSIYNNFSTFGIENIEAGVGADEVKITFSEKNLPLAKWFIVGSSIDIKSLFVFQMINSPNTPLNPLDRPDVYFKTARALYNGSASDIVLSVEPIVDVIKVKSSALREMVDRNIQSIPAGPRGGTLNYLCISHFVTGFIKSNDPEPLAGGVDSKYAGGIRTRAISINGDLGRRKTVFSYVNPTSGKPSGVTSFVPYNIVAVHYPSRLDFIDHFVYDGSKKYEKQRLMVYLSQFQTLVDAPYLKAKQFVNEAPGPQVMYEYVTQHDYFNNTELDTYSEHRFKVFNEEMLTRENEISLVTIKNEAIDVGNILHTKVYNAQGDPVKTTTYGYLYDDVDEPYEQEALSSKQGVIEQSFHKYIRLRAYNIEYDFHHALDVAFGSGGVDVEVNTTYDKEKKLVTKRQDRSNVLTSVVETDHRLGVTTSTQNHSFDFYTGEARKVLTTDSYGNSFMAVTEPAYENYPAMGLKIYDIKNKHMMTQEAASYMYQVNPSTYVPVGLLSASIVTWSNKTKILDMTVTQDNIWRKNSTYVWNGVESLQNEGTYSYDDFKLYPFNWNVQENDLNKNEHWLKTSEVTLYDVYSKGLEEKDVNDLYSSVRLDHEHRYVLAGASNARYAEMAYSGAENSSVSMNDEGGVGRGNGTISRGAAHTGEHSLLVAKGEKGFNYSLDPTQTDLTKKYRASVWVKGFGKSETQSILDKIELYYAINGHEVNSIHPIIRKSKSKDWYLLTLDITPAGANEIFIGVRNNTTAGVYFDDFRIHPLNASLVSYVYDQHTGAVSYILDANNFYTHFEYDDAGRLIRTSKELLNFDYGDGKESDRERDAILNDIKYNFKKSN